MSITTELRFSSASRARRFNVLTHHDETRAAMKLIDYMAQNSYAVCAAKIAEGKSDRALVLQHAENHAKFDNANDAEVIWEIIDSNFPPEQWVTTEALNVFISDPGLRERMGIDPSKCTGKFSMKRWVRLHKDGEHMGIDTNITEEYVFWPEFARVLSAAIENKYLGDSEYQLARWLPQAFEVVAHLRGYKSDVALEQIVKSGEVYSGNQEVFTSERPLTLVTTPAMESAS